MNICDYCFNDEEVQIAICNESVCDGICDICGRYSRVVDAMFLSDFFGEVLSLFSPCVDGMNIVSFLQRDWNLFVNEKVGYAIIDFFLNQWNYGYVITDKVCYVDSIQNIISVWDDLKYKVKKKSRFFTSLETFDKLGLIRCNLVIPTKTILYRARVIPSGKDFLVVEEMGCPPIEYATAGRANPLGIPYLYLCQNEETTYYEVRALYLDKLAIGSFETSRDLKIMDFTKQMSLYVANVQSSDLATEVSKYILLQRISKDLSKPLRRFDSELEYVPTQLICEYCKLNGIDGIQFYSSVHNGGVNVVLFDAQKADCKSVKIVEIKSVRIALS